MASLSRHLANGQIGATSAALYTATARVTLTSVLLHNATATNVTWGMWRVPSGASATDANEVYSNQSILAEMTDGADYLVGQVLEIGDAIHGIASSAASVTYSISGMVHA